MQLQPNIKAQDGNLRFYDSNIYSYCNEPISAVPTQYLQYKSATQQKHHLYSFCRAHKKYTYDLMNN